MNRILFRNVWLVSIIGLLLMAYNLFQKGQDNNQRIFRKNASLARLQNEKEEIRKLSAALDQLDKRTINETTATQLSLLRHLDLETKDYTFSVLSKQTTDYGEIPLFLRRVQVQANVSYREALALMDQLHQTNKISLDQFELKRPTEHGDKVQVTVSGTMYGLDKNE